MTPLDAITRTLIGARGGLSFLAVMGLFACWMTGQPASMVRRWRRRMFAGLSVAVLLFQYPRLAWLLGTPREVATRSVDLVAVLVIAGVLIAAIALFSIERGVPVERVRRSIVANGLVFAGMVAVGWAFH